MPCKLNRPAFQQLIAEDLEWLRQQPDTLERHHIEQVLLDCEQFYYPPADDGATVRVFKAGVPVLEVPLTTLLGNQSR